MPLNKVKGNMYDWVTHTWNPIKGICPHRCRYCYMDVPKLRPKEQLHLDEKCLNDNLGKGNTIFVGSSTDMWAQGSWKSWQDRVINHCREYPENTYVFQTKNPLFMLPNHFPSKCLLGCTIETTAYDSPLLYDSKTPPPVPNTRYEYMRYERRKTFISMEPIMDFNLDEYVQWMKDISPLFVSIGANSRRDVKLPEPPPEKINELILELRKFTKVKVKDNLKRLLKTKEVAA